MPIFKQPKDSIVPLYARNRGIYNKTVEAFTEKAAAELLGVVPSTLNEWAADHMDRAMQVLAAVNLKVVPRTEMTLPAAEIAAYKLLARKAMELEEPTSDWGTL